MSPREPHILGFSDSVHDRSVCLFRGAAPLVAIEEERLTRQKHGIDFRGHDLRDAGVFAKLGLDRGHSDEHEARLLPLVDYCLRAAGLERGQIDLWVGNSLHVAFPFTDRAVFVNHHRAHAASAFFASGFDEAAVLVIDGYGDALSAETYETVSIYAGQGTELALRHRVDGQKRGLHLGNSAGILYRIGTLLSGFGIVDEGKLMGLAAYGTPRFLPIIQAHVSMDGPTVLMDNEGVWQDFLAQGLQGGSFEQRADIAASFQAALEQIVLHYAMSAGELCGSRRLCIAGGVGLNCVANQRIVDSGRFDEVFVFPAAGDNGISFGAAYLGAHAVYGLERGEPLRGASFGRSYSTHEAEAALAAAGVALTVERLDAEAMTARAAAAIAADRMIMWFQGGSEFGPRALGNRSVLGDPRDAGVRDHINAAVKSREAFRPLAPVVLDEEREHWFESGSSPFMLFSPPARERTRELAPAIVHVDGSARLQTVNRSVNQKLHALIAKFQAITGIPILLNTSFNIRSQPIVERPEDAVAAFLESPVRVLCLDDLYVEKRAGEAS